MTFPYSFIAIALLLLSSWAGAQSPRVWQLPETYGHEIWQTEQGLPQNTVQAILQTRDGYVWVATKEGLARFDGIRFTIFDRQNTPQILHNQIRSLFEDREGRLWIATPSGLTQYQHGIFTSFTTKEGLASNNVWSVYEDRFGSLWIASVNGLSCYQAGKFTNYTTQQGLSHNSIEAVLEDKDGNLWIGTEHGLNRYKDGKFTVYEKKDGLAGDSIKSLFADQGGRLWIGTTAGVSFLASGKFTSYNTNLGDAEFVTADKSGAVWFGSQNGLSRWQSGTITSFTTKQGLPENRITSLFTDHAGVLWAGTSGGLVQWRENKFVRATMQEGLSGTAILSLYEDREGTLWIGTEASGLNLLKIKKVTTFTTREGLSANVIRSIFGDRNGNIWIGTQERGLNLFSNGQLTTFPAQQNFARDDVMAIADDVTGNLWIGTTQGLRRVNGGRVTTFTVKDGLPDDFIRSLYASRDGSLWIGTRRGLAHFINGEFVPYTTLDGLASDLVGAICEDRAGNLWIGTLGGLSRFKGEKFTNYTTDAGLSSEVIISLYQDGADGLWVGTHGGGLNYFKDGKFSHFTTKDGLPDDVIYQILADGNENLWMSSNKGIIRVSRKELESRAGANRKLESVLTFGTADGMETRECSGGGHPAGWKSADGKLWFATIKGVAIIDPARLQFNQQPPLVALEKIVVDDLPVAMDNAITLAPGKTRFEFYYTGLSFVAPQNVTFKYKLENFDQDWVDAGTRRVAGYTNIPAGKYRFVVMARNNDGVWSESAATVEFVFQPRFYQTWWFYALCLLSLGLAIWLWYRARVKRLEGQFSAVLAERNRIAREIHDTLAQGFAGLSVQLELVARMLSISPQNAKTHLDQARQLVRSSLDEARRSVWALRSQALENSDLPSALNDTVKNLVADTSMQAQVQVTGTYRELKSSIEDNLLRIGQEAITNAIKHAQAKNLHVTLSYVADAVCLRVQDDGRGFDDSVPRPNRNGHFGLVGMRERVEQLGGRLTISSRPQTGTEIVVEVPLGKS